MMNPKKVRPLRCTKSPSSKKRLTFLSNVVAYPGRHSREEDRQMATPGQPTLYKPEYCELAHNYCLPGAANDVLAGRPRPVRAGMRHAGE
jgi:hypothetical protein